MAEVIEVRCPVGPQRLFSKLKLGEESARKVDPGNLLEFSCSDCSRRLSKETGELVRVYHQFNFIGDCVRTLVQRPGQRSPAAPTD